MVIVLGASYIIVGGHGAADTKTNTILNYEDHYCDGSNICGNGECHIRGGTSDIHHTNEHKHASGVRKQ